MITLSAAALGFLLPIGLTSLRLHVAFAVFAVSIAGAWLHLGVPATLEYGTQYRSATNTSVLVAVPLFVLLGEFLVRGGFTDRMYRSLADWPSPLPGGLLHSNLGACALFAAVSGSSGATAATVGTVALPAFDKRGYDQRLVLGTIAAGATLGILIPPSINMIIYGAMTNTSVGRLYAGGIVPGVVLTLLFMGVVVVAVRVRPALAGPGGRRADRRAPAPARRPRAADRRLRQRHWGRSTAVGRRRPNRRRSASSSPSVSPPRTAG